MENLETPQLISGPFAYQGQKTDIPDAPTGTAHASIQEGFPPITMIPQENGGEAPYGQDFNGLGNLLSQFYFYTQNGGMYTFEQEVSDKIGGYPLNAILWYFPEDGTPEWLRSTKANNTDNFVTNSEFIGTSWVSIATNKSLPYPLFLSVWSDHIFNDANWLRADTFSWQSGNVYTAAYNELAAEYANEEAVDVTDGDISYKRTPKGYKIAASSQEEAISNLYDETGVAWYYIIDTANKRFKLPRTKYSFVGLRSSAGNYVPESLPNITGTGVWNLMGQNAGGTGAIGSLDQFINSNVGGHIYGGNSGFSFDASKSSPAYQNGATVQQRATEMYLYFFVGNTTVNETEIDIGELSEVINNKVDINFGNVDEAGRKKVVGWGMPNVNATITNVGNHYTAPCDGIYWFSVPNNNNSRNIIINNITYNVVINSYGTTGGFSVLLAKDDVIDIASATQSLSSSYFVPLKGVNENA